jgi:hypothetical protein
VHPPPGGERLPDEFVDDWAADPAGGTGAGITILPDLRGVSSTGGLGGQRRRGSAR